MCSQESTPWKLTHTLIQKVNRKKVWKWSGCENVGKFDCLWNKLPRQQSKPRWVTSACCWKCSLALLYLFCTFHLAALRYWSAGSIIWSTCMDTRVCFIFIFPLKKKIVTTYDWAGRTLRKVTGGNWHCSPLRTPIAQTAASHTVTGIGCNAPLLVSIRAIKFSRTSSNGDTHLSLLCISLLFARTLTYGNFFFF